jgi:glycosidase
MKRTILLVLLLGILSACAPVIIEPVTPVSSPDTLSQQSWWRNTVFYEIFVRSYCDSDGNGIGDFNGITSKLDYLQSLGIKGIWLMPINPSPSYHGYDVLNYYAVNPQYGTMDDFKTLVAEAHARGIRIIIDLVLNHTSSQHPFFVDANNNPQSPYRDWYIWADSYSANHWYTGMTGYYYAFFGSGMPDLNYKNPDVTAQMYNVVRFWLKDVGIDGFRIDAAKHLIEEGLQLEGTESTHAWLRDFHAMYNAENPEAYTVGEIYGAGAFAAKAYTGDQLDQIFNFEMSSGFTGSALGGSNTGINSAITFALEDMPGGEYATFLTNHDQNRIMSTLNGNVGKARVAASLMLTSPGTPFIYYGEEIGMEGKKPDEDIRLPMQWSEAANAGFTTGVPWRAPAANYLQANVADETNDPDSLLSYYRNLITIRNQHPALRYGSISSVSTNNPGVYAALRVSDSETILILVNLTKNPINNYALSLQTASLPDGSYQLDSILGAGMGASLGISGGVFNNSQPLAELSPYSTYILLISPK